MASSADLIAAVDAVAEVDRALADLAVRREKYGQKVASLSAEYQSRLDSWREEAQRAREAADVPPPKPEPPIADEDHRATVTWFANEHERLTDQRRHTVAASTDDIEQKARDEVTAAREDAREHITALRHSAARIEAARQALSTARTAQDDVSGMRRERAHTGYTPHDLIDLTDDTDPLAAITAPRHLGMTSWSVSDEERRAPEPPLPPPVHRVVPQRRHWD